MEKTNDWTWSKRKYNSISHLQPPTHPNSYRDSWEEQAFAVDAAGGLIGGCVWPPRSYSCSFCRREFRSAQALGGHMNVHRRDRARLNQSPYPHNNETLPKHQYHDQDHIPNPCTSLGCKPNHPGPDQVVFSSPSLASSFSPAPLATLENRDERIFLPTVSPRNSIENLRIQSTPSSRSNLKMVVRQIRRAGDGEEEEGMIMSCKRRRTTDSNSSGDRNSTPLQSEVLDQLSSTSTEEEEEVDLELRLGYHQPEVM
ncbi:hypothetical protein RHSIM_Rhsim04G0161800 [Rhododendron simsii]|uniref:C2H2-type domain-containing protein n=1 Tax=Rhododendron simsii TaxID=118357 RepID=A0A834HAB4_RHOSS|nr:hypothetical protein RHSIM_Rhsim04G0161800 [Rhododendron simsii]